MSTQTLTLRPVCFVHPDFGVSVFGWEIAGTAVWLDRYRQKESWQARPFSMLAREWLERNALIGVQFPTRAEALRVIEALHAADPIPTRREPAVKLVRKARGRHETADGTWVVQRRSEGGWDIWRRDPQRASTKYMRGTLHEARLFIDGNA